jgi:hypothetical protein
VNLPRIAARAFCEGINAKEVWHMTRKHFTDLTAIDCPFGELDDDTQARLKAWPHGWDVSGENCSWTNWKIPGWSPRIFYRARRASDAKPEPAGPVITETVKRIVPGVYGAVKISHPNSRYVRVNIDASLEVECIRAAISTLTEIADALEGGAK